MMSSRLRIATLSSVVRVFNAVVFTIPLRAATIFGPFIKPGIPNFLNLSRSGIIASILSTRSSNSSSYTGEILLVNCSS